MTSNLCPMNQQDLGLYYRLCRILFIEFVKKWDGT